MPFADYVREAVCTPLGAGARPRRSPGWRHARLRRRRAGALARVAAPDARRARDQPGDDERPVPGARRRAAGLRAFHADGLGSRRRDQGVEEPALVGCAHLTAHVRSLRRLRDVLLGRPGQGISRVHASRRASSATGPRTPGRRSPTPSCARRPPSRVHRWLRHACQPVNASSVARSQRATTHAVTAVAGPSATSPGRSSPLPPRARPVRSTSTVASVLPKLTPVSTSSRSIWSASRASCLARDRPEQTDALQLGDRGGHEPRHCAYRSGAVVSGRGCSDAGHLLRLDAQLRTAVFSHSNPLRSGPTRKSSSLTRPSVSISPPRSPLSQPEPQRIGGCGSSCEAAVARAARRRVEDRCPARCS